MASVVNVTAIVGIFLTSIDLGLAVLRSALKGFACIWIRKLERPREESNDK